MTTAQESPENRIRSLTMPENYDFSQRKINWKSYARDYILRTDAVWEKHKLFAYFYSVYKAVRLFLKFRKKFMVTMESTMIFQLNMPGKDSKTETSNGTSLRKSEKKMKMSKRSLCSEMELLGNMNLHLWSINPKLPVSFWETETKTSPSSAP